MRAQINVEIEDIRATCGGEGVVRSLDVIRVGAWLEQQSVQGFVVLVHEPIGHTAKEGILREKNRTCFVELLNTMTGY